MDNTQIVRHYLLLVFLLANISIYSQESGTIEEENQQPELLVFDDCTVSNYKFRAHGVYYNHKDIIQFCPRCLPDTIEVVDQGGTPVTFPVTWTNAIPNTANNYSAIIDSTNYNKKEDIIASFAGGPIKLRKRKPSSLNINNTDTRFSFDHNTIMQYPSPIHNIPWKFIESTQMVTMEAFSKSYKSACLKTSNSSLIVSPPKMASKTQPIVLNHPSSVGTTPKEIDVYGCSKDPELHVLVGDAIHKTVNFVYLCDSLGNCPQILNTNEQTLLNEANLVLNKAGLYLSLQNVFRDTFDTQYSVTITDSLIIKDSTIFNGIDTIIVKDTTIIKDTIIVKDRLSEKLSIKISDKELSKQDQILLSVIKYNIDSTSLFTSDYLVYVAFNLGKARDKYGNITNNDVLGRGTNDTQGIPNNSLSIDAQQITSGNTLAHEFGHAAFKFIHPQDRTKPVTGDYNNFMFYTGSTIQINNSNVTRTSNIRAYQFKEIHKIR